MGKSTLLLNMLVDDIQSRRGVCLVDPHGDLSEALLELIPKHRTNDVILFDAADREHPVAFNPLACREASQRPLVADGVLTVLKRQFGEFFGPRMEDIHPASPQNLTEEIFCVRLHPFSDHMKKSARASAPESSRSQWLERLIDAVNHLAEELRVARDVMDEIREDLGWITRNGIPGRHGERTQLVRMARDPLAPNANASLRVLTSTVASNNSSELASDVFDELVSEITEAVTVVGQEQVNLLLTALDDARAKLVAAIKASSAVPNVENAPTTSEPLPPPTLPPAAKPTDAGRLF